MKKLVSLLLVVACMFTMIACGGEEKSGESSKVLAKVIEIDLTEEEYAFGVDKNQPELLASVNEFVKGIKEDGTLDAICDKYFGDGEKTGVESAKLDDTKDQLVVATNAEFAPFEYMEGDKYYGIDMEIAKLLADKLGKELVIQNMDFDAVCLTVGQSKCDIAMAGLTVSADREEYVTFSESYYQASQRLIIKSNNKAFDGCTDAASVEAILNGLTESTKIGVQTGTTGQLYVEGDESWGFAGLPVTCQSYDSGALAIQDMLNGNIDYVVIDAAPAQVITESINEMR